MQKQEEERKLNRNNGRELSNDNFNPINFYPLANGDFIWDRAERGSFSPPFHPKQKINQEYAFEAESAFY